MGLRMKAVPERDTRSARFKTKSSTDLFEKSLALHKLKKRLWKKPEEQQHDIVNLLPI